MPCVFGEWILRGLLLLLPLRGELMQRHDAIPVPRLLATHVVAAPAPVGEALQFGGADEEAAHAFAAHDLAVLAGHGKEPGLAENGVVAR
jgi:hypothetical protein